MSHADLVGAIDRLPTTPWAGHAFRHVAAGRAALSGEGARLVGGRWNPQASFPVLYLGLSRDAVLAEFHRLATRQGLPLASFLPRTFFTYEVELEALLDLREPTARAAVGLDDRDLSADVLAPCQAVGEAAHACGREGVLVPGAAGRGDILAAFVGRLGSASSLKDIAAEQWEFVPET